MRTFNFLLALCIVFVFAACGSDTCPTEDWVGTYNKQSESCADSTVLFAQMIVITESTEAGKINMNGTAVPIDDVQCSITIGGDTVTLEDNGLRFTVGECTAIYE